MSMRIVHDCDCCKAKDTAVIRVSAIVRYRPAPSLETSSTVIDGLDMCADCLHHALQETVNKMHPSTAGAWVRYWRNLK